MYAVGKHGESLKERRKAKRRKFNFIASSLCSRASGFGFCSCYTLFSDSPKCLFRGGSYRFQLLLPKPSHTSQIALSTFSPWQLAWPGVNQQKSTQVPPAGAHGAWLDWDGFVPTNQSIFMYFIIMVLLYTISAAF